MPEKKFSKLHFFRQKLSASSRLPLGGRLLAKQGGEGQPNNNQAFSRQKAALYSTRVSRLPLGGKLLAKQGGEGQPNNIQVFFSKSRFTSNRFPGFPVGEAVGFCRLKRSLHVFPLPEKKFSKLHFFRQKCEALPCVKASPWGAFLAELPFKAASAACSLRSKVVRGAAHF